MFSAPSPFFSLNSGSLINGSTISLIEMPSPMLLALAEGISSAVFWLFIAISLRLEFLLTISPIFEIRSFGWNGFVRYSVIPNIFTNFPPTSSPLEVTSIIGISFNSGSSFMILQT